MTEDEKKELFRAFIRFYFAYGYGKRNKIHDDFGAILSAWYAGKRKIRNLIFQADGKFFNADGRVEWWLWAGFESGMLDIFRAERAETKRQRLHVDIDGPNKSSEVSNAVSGSPVANGRQIKEILLKLNRIQFADIQKRLLYSIYIKKLTYDEILDDLGLTVSDTTLSRWKQAIVEQLKAVLNDLRPGHDYTETEIKEALSAYLYDLGHSLDETKPPSPVQGSHDQSKVKKNDR